MTRGSPIAGRVLLVEDDPAIREEVVDLLHEQGYQVLVAQNGREALDHLTAERRPCVILLDLMMPEMDGWAFRSEQLKHAAIADIPVVILSGVRSLPTEAAQLGVSEYLLKPFTAQKLLRAVQTYCP